MTSKTSDFPSGLSLSGDLFSNNSVNSFYDSELNDFSGFNRNFQEDSFFSGSSNTPSYDESLLFDTSSPSQVGSPMDESMNEPIPVPQHSLSKQPPEIIPVFNLGCKYNFPAQQASKTLQESESKKKVQPKRRRAGTVEDLPNDRDTKVQKMNNNNFPTVLPSRDEILEMSSKEFENRIERIEQSQILSSREAQEIKVYKRLIKNRESAQASRQKKKQIVRELEQRVIELEEENFKLRRSVAVTAAENIALKTDLQYYKNRIPNANNNTNINNNNMQVVNPPFIPRVTQVQPTNTTMRGMMMLVVLLSFGLLVGNVGFPSLNKQHSLLESSTTRVFNTEQGTYKPVSNPTMLSDILKSNKGQSHFNDRLLDSNSSPSTGDSSFDWKPNTTYLMCNTMKHIVPPAEVTKQFDPQTPQNLTFFIMPGSDKTEEAEKVLEITCLMSSMSFLPMGTVSSLKDVAH